MYCDGCGSPFAAGAQYCRSCGKRILGVPAAAPAGAAAGWPASAGAARAAGDGRVGRNIQLLAGLWLASGILRLIGLTGAMAFRHFTYDGGWGWWAPGWPFHFGPWLLFGGATLGFLGIVHLLLAWGLYQREPWARMLGIVIGILALVRFPFGTALGIYTLWVLAPNPSGREYDAMTMGSARVSEAR